MGRRLTQTFDVQAHRGGAGLTVENTLAAFGRALEIGVRTLECDVHLTADGVPVVVHDRRLGAEKYADTGPAVDGDPFFPYVGALVPELTLAQLRTIDAGSRPLATHPEQRPAPGAPIPLLTELFELLADRGADAVGINLETKFDALAPEESSPRERFAEVLVAAVHAAGLVERVSIQSFDWGVLRLVRAAEPRLRLNVLASPRNLEAGATGASPWLDGTDIDEFAGDLVRAVAGHGFDAISPSHGYPFTSGVDDPAYQPFTTPSMVQEAHAAGLRVIPYTVDDAPTMRALIDLGVDGLITNHPDRLRGVLAERGEPVPRQYPAPHGPIPGSHP